MNCRICTHTWSITRESRRRNGCGCSSGGSKWGNGGRNTLAAAGRACASSTGRLAQWTAECWRRQILPQSCPRPCFTQRHPIPANRKIPRITEKAGSYGCPPHCAPGASMGRFSYLSISTRLARLLFPYQLSLRETSAFGFTDPAPAEHLSTRFSGRTFHLFS